VQLTQEEYVNKGKEMSREQNAMTNLAARLKEVSSDFKAKIAQKEATINALSMTISNGYEYREVECAWAYRASEGVKDLARMDTREVVSTERMSKEDFQNNLPLDGDEPMEKESTTSEKGEVIDAIMIEHLPDDPNLSQTGNE
jgi:hypothetical protein